MFRISLKALCISAMLAPAAGQSQQIGNLAQDGLEKTIQHLSGNSDQAFEMGMLQTLRAVEKTLQARYEFNLTLDRLGLPVLRLGLGNTANPTPKPTTPGTLSNIVELFIADMAQARATLETVETTNVTPFQMTLQDIWFDININGVREKGEGAMALLGPVVLGRRANQEFSNSDTAETPLTVRFDAADHSWLLAYTHMLSSFGNLYMAFDPEPVFRDLAAQRELLSNAPQVPNFYNQDEVRNQITRLETDYAEVEKAQDEHRALIQPLYDQQSMLRARLKRAEDQATKTKLQEEIDQTQEKLKLLRRETQQLSQNLWSLRNELNAAKEKLSVDSNSPAPGGQRNRNDFREPIELLYVALTSLRQNPDPTRIQAANDSWLAMIGHNRNFWSLLDKETDNDREWIPNSNQTSALPVTVSPQVAEGWQNILADAQAVLEGKLLIPHPMLPDGYGISLPAYVNNPSPLDLIEWVHGIAAYPYAAKGPRITGQSWQAFRRLTQGNAGGFALFFN